MKNSFSQRKIPWWVILGSIVLWLGIWELAFLMIHNEVFLPGPVTVLGTLLRLGTTAKFWAGLWFTTSRIVLGFLIGFVLGIFFGLVGLLHPYLQYFLSIPMKVIRAVPVASFVILALLWVDGQGLTILIVASVVMPILYQGIIDGAKASDPKLLQVSRLYHTGRIRTFLHAMLPNMMPTLKASVSTASGIAFKSGVAAEIIGLVKNSVGNYLYQSKLYLETPELLAWTIAIILIGFAFERLLRFLLGRIFR